MTDINPSQGVVVVDGVPFSLTYDEQGNNVVTAASQKAIVQGSPLVVTFDPPVPVANFAVVGVPQIEAALAKVSSGGARPNDGGNGPPKPPHN